MLRRIFWGVAGGAIGALFGAGFWMLSEMRGATGGSNVIEWGAYGAIPLAVAGFIVEDRIMLIANIELPSIFPRSVTWVAFLVGIVALAILVYVGS